MTRYAADTSDRVLVLDKGIVKEYGSPAVLIRDPKSAFYGLCMAQGQEEYERLHGAVSGSDVL